MRSRHRYLASGRHGPHRTAAIARRHDARRSPFAIVGEHPAGRFRQRVGISRPPLCALADRHHRSRRRWEPNDLANGSIAATAELASVELCSAPETHPPKPPPRHHAACLRGAMFIPGRRRCRSPRRVPPPTNAAGTSPHPDKSGWWRETGKDTRSGSEHGSTVASTVVAIGAGRIAQTNDQDQAAGT